VINKPLTKNRSTQEILQAVLAKGFKVEVISKRFNLLRVKYNSKSLFIKGTSFPVNNQPACFIANNKFLTKRVLRMEKIPTPKSWLVRTTTEAKKTVLKHNLFPCVLKPAKGAHGNKVFANIESFAEFCEILPLVFTSKGRKNVLIEEFIDGRDYRVLVVGNKASAVMERIRAHIIGDGVKNIRQLIKKFNQNPLVGQKYEKPLCKIKINGEVKRILKKQNKKITYIPKKNEIVFLRQNANISTGGIGKDATDKVDPLVKSISIKAAKALGIKITGVDIIYDKIKQMPYVLELNDCPGIDIHHYPVSGQSRKVAEDIVEFLIRRKLNV